MKKIKILLSTIVGLLSVGTLATGFTYAWLSTATTVVNFDNAGGGIVSNYFHCGKGTEDEPYVITRPVHLYNLVELMYADADNFQVFDKYFQLGYDLDGDEETLEFYTYNDYGVLQDGSYSNVLNMKYYSGDRALLPIGQYDPNDSDYHIPFSGTFDGSDLTIANLEIVGGAGIDDLGFFGYVTSDATIHNLYLDNLTINVAACASGIHTGQNLENSHPENANVGYIAGHIENSNCFENVYVNNSTITGTGAVKIHNDWGYFGRCDNSKTLEDFIQHAGAPDPSWGGSVNMLEMFERLYTIAGSATRNNNYVYEKDVIDNINGTTSERNVTSARAYTYRNTQRGSFVFSSYASNSNATDDGDGNYLYLSGGTRCYPYKQVETQVSGGQAISYNGHFLGVSGTSIADHQDGWRFNNNILSIVLSGVTYYLTHNLTLSTSTQETWTKYDNKLYYTSGNIFNRRYNYLTYDNGWVVKTTSSRSDATTLTWTSTTYTVVSEANNGEAYMDYSGTNVTYFPLITKENSNDVDGKNTGYVIGGSEDKTTSTTYPYKTGDIRVSRYAKSNISQSYSNNNFTTIYTINSNIETVPINNSNSSSFEKYLNSKSDFLNTLNGDDNIHGLHFMSAKISKDHLVNADYALINGREKTNYKMPSSSIDFNLASKGTINFFAGTYFSGNNSFFSLHHIERNDDDEIESIKEIDEIYKSTNSRKKYIYKYSDGTYSGEKDDTYSLAFSTSRIKKQASLTLKAVYYFEIPVNAGEYALGSVDGGTGAYLMYLDIGSNGGVDFTADVNSFGSVEYRSATAVATTSLVLITYEQAENQTVALKVVYKKQDGKDVYEITYSGTIEQIIITVLSREIEVYFNGEMLPQAQQSNYRSGTTS